MCNDNNYNLQYLPFQLSLGLIYNTLILQIDCYYAVLFDLLLRINFEPSLHRNNLKNNENLNAEIIPRVKMIHIKGAPSRICPSPVIINLFKLCFFLMRLIGTVQGLQIFYILNALHFLISFNVLVKTYKKLFLILLFSKHCQHNLKTKNNIKVIFVY